MSFVTLLVFLIVALIVIGLLWLLFRVDSPFRKDSQAALRKAAHTNLRSLVDSQRKLQTEGVSHYGEKVDGTTLASAAAIESGLSKEHEEEKKQRELRKKLFYARLPILPIHFRLFQVVCALTFLIPAIALKSFVLAFLAVCLGIIFSNSVLGYLLERRFKAFDVDYPVMILSLVGLLKTGLDTLSALEYAGKGLPETSLVRREIELMLERIRLGLDEAQAIGSFGEDIPHPEIELFVQALLLSETVGGKLSSTLERLSKQVRKRQQFRSHAKAAVAMERGSTYAVGFLMTALILYLGYKSPDLILPMFKSPLGKTMFESGLTVIVLGFIWARKVSNIKI